MATPNASRLAEIILKRAEPIQKMTERVEILIDRQGADREGWQAAQQKLRDAAARLLLLENTPDLAARRKMNAPSVIDQARAEVDRLQTDADRLRDAVRDCFVIVTVRSLTEEETTTAQAKHATQRDRESALIATAITAITDHEGGPLIDVDYEAALGFVDWLRGDALSFQLLRNAVNTAGIGVDFPT